MAGPGQATQRKVLTTQTRRWTMLVLSRIEGEKIIIQAGEHRIEVTVLRVGSRVQLGFDAPKPEVNIYRKELEDGKKDILRG